MSNLISNADGDRIPAIGSAARKSLAGNHFTAHECATLEALAAQSPPGNGK